MIDIISVDNMRLSDKCTIENNTPSQELMRRAGLVLFKALHWKGNVNIVAGFGNNGGDGFALACFLADAGYCPVVYTLSEKFTVDAAYFKNLALSKGVIVNEYVEGLNQLDDADIIVDCIFGTGFDPSREMPSICRAAIEEINSYPKKYKVSCDINSGMNGDTGETNLCVKSDLTICIQAIKKGLLFGSEKYCHSIVVGDIGIRLVYEDDKLLFEDEFNSNEGKRTFFENGFTYFLDDGHRHYKKPPYLALHFVSYK